MPPATIRVEVIRPFIDASHDVFRTMLGLTLKRHEVYIKRGYRMFGDMTAVIGLSGPLAGTCALSMPGVAVRASMERLLGEPLDEDLRNPALRDGAGELINMIAGAARTTLGHTPYRFEITLPTIISGAGHEVFHRANAHCVVVVFDVPDLAQRVTLDIAVAA